MQRTHRKRIVPTKMNGKLLFEIFKGIKFLSSIKIFVILSMRSFHLTLCLGVKGRISLCLIPNSLRRTSKSEIFPVL